jgi:hypothetical protein
VSLRTRLSDRVHAATDRQAREHGWTVVHSTGMLGFGARTYHDPRLAAALLARAATVPAARAEHGRYRALADGREARRAALPSRVAAERPGWTEPR